MKVIVADDPLIRGLLTQTSCYDHPVGELRLIETHISWVLLAGEYAYKIKKPVDLGFLDFSTLALRREACNEEIRLNRRLAPDYYLGVVEITGTPERPHFGGAGVCFEYAVKMRRFPSEDTLDCLAACGRLDAAMIDRLAVRLANFHTGVCAVAAADSPWGEPAGIAHPVAENFELLETYLSDQGPRLARLRAWCEDEHRRLEPLMLERKHGGFVRECHGDLHLANLAWVNDELVIFDCIEFNPALRWIDVISEVAFCYMDLLHRGQDEMASRFLNAWLEISGDYRGVALLRYYVVYRALVRAKVAALRGAQRAAETDRAELESCLQLAERFVLRVRPRLSITHGLSGAGKTTLSQLLLQREGAIRLRSDVERKRMAGLGALERCSIGFEQGLYSPQVGRQTYLRLAEVASELLAQEWPVIVDAAFLKREQRDRFRELAQHCGAEFRILDVVVTPQELSERVVRRSAHGGDASDADLAVLQSQIATAEPLAADELVHVVRSRPNDDSKSTGEISGVLLI